MNRDNVLFVIIGLLVGFIAGYLLHDQMAVRQPARLPAGSAASTASAASPATPLAGSPGPAGVDTSGQPPMEAINRLRQYVEQNPDDAEAVVLLGNLNFEIQNWSKAQELYTHYLELKPGNPDVTTDLGICYRNLGEPQKALELFHQAEAMSPTHWQSRYNEVVVLAFDLDQLDEAAKVLSELEKLQPDNPSVTELANEVERRRGQA